jgi:DtxR family transcriptional regulator, Mn-dependent transcriptional regulator
MKDRKAAEEYLEAIWMLLEKSGSLEGDLEISRLREYIGSGFTHEILTQLATQQSISLTERTVSFTPTGLKKSRQLIRAHRLAERLLHDVLGIEDYEVGACEFEHIIDTNLIDSICTLLGHPRRCPDGLPIPEGACCRSGAETPPAPTVAVVRMRTGESGRVATVNADDDTRLHVLENLQIRPGSLLKVHQVSPTIVVECEGSTIALDETIAACIHVWPQRSEPTEAGQRHGHEAAAVRGRRRRGPHRKEGHRV